MDFNSKGLAEHALIPVMIDEDLVPIAYNDVNDEMERFIVEVSRPITEGTLTWQRWYEEIVGEYLSGNMRSFIIRIRKYGIRHLLQCLL